MNETDLLSIREFADYVGVRQSILRHYDRIGLFSPIHRGENGYRYYSPLQITSFNMVNVLCDLKTALREITHLQRSRTPESILEHLEKQEEKFDEEMRQLQESYSIAHVYRRLIKEALAVDQNAIVEKYMPERTIFMGAENKFKDNASFFSDFIAFSKYARKRGVNLSYPVGAMFTDMDVFAERPSMPNYFYSTDPHGSVKKEAGNYLIAYTHGYYGEVNDIADRIIEYAKQHRLSFNGPVYSLYLLDEVSMFDPEKYMARICVQVKKK